MTNRYPWGALGQQADAIISGRLSAEILAHYTGLETLSYEKRRDAALVELLATSAQTEGVQPIAYAAAITPDALAGGVVDVGALTSNITINAPTNPFPGLRLTFRFVQSGTSGGAVTWNAVFLHSWTNDGNTRADARSSVTFAYDGTNWVQVGAQQLWSGAAPLDAAGDLSTSVLGGFRQQIDGWYQNNLGAGQAVTEMTRGIGRFTPTRPGSVTGLALKSNEARIAGTATLKVYKNTGLAGAAGAYLGLSVVLSAGAVTATSLAKDVLPFGTGEELYLTLESDGSWSPITADLTATLEVET